MQLPSEIPQFVHPTLIVLGSHTEVIFLFAKDNIIEECDRFEKKEELKSDNEGGFINIGTNSINAPEDHHKEERIKRIVREMGERLAKQAKEKEVVYIDLVMPADLCHVLEAELPKQLVEKINRQIHADLIRESWIDIAKRLFEK